MNKPESNLYKEILDFTMSSPQISALLKQRDSHNDAYMSEIAVKFYRQNEIDNNRSAYSVNFLYNTRYPDQEKNDDIKCYVEVISLVPVKYKILKVIID